ncbi:MAG: carboxypeptidase regulatory-like domain-containing protein, partial [Candidatus Acidiferrales bacterium]
FLAYVFSAASPLHAQSTVATGNIQGTVTDPTGAVVATAKITITNTDTGQVVHVASSSAGTYNSGALVPGNYSVRVEAAGFKTVQQGVIVRVGEISGINVSLQVGESNTVVTVAEQSVAVNTEQPSVQGVLNQEQIENLPVNGRNFLDLAQLEPGVQIQDGADFDPTKVGFSSISFGGRFGRTARIEVDGVDVSDETVGTTTENIPASAIEEFQISQSTLDLSNELTSSGAVNVTTRSGTNSYHGEGFALFRDSDIAAALPGPPSPYQRNQDGGNFGGPILKDKVFFFLDAEHTNQNLLAPIVPAPPFDVYTGNTGTPFRETDYMARLDFNLFKNVRMFYRFSYFDSKAVATGGTVGYQPYQDKNYTRTHVIGADFTTGSGFTHSIRFEYLKFINNLGDTVLGSGLPFANFPVSLNFASFGFLTGPNFLAPQQTYQTDRQIKYDGSKVLGSHILRYGVAYNRLRGGGLFSFSAFTPNVSPIGSTDEINNAAAGTLICPGGPAMQGAACPLNYPVDNVTLGNGQECDTEIPAFNAPCSGTPVDNRIGLYVGDSWKLKPNLNITYGLRYVRDTGRSDSDLPGFTGDAATELNAVMPGLANRVRQPNHNFGPQLGIAWDPRNDSKTVIRAGIGVFYENAIWNNAEFDRPERLATGAFLANPTACFSGTGVGVPIPVPGASPNLDFLGGNPTTAGVICSSLIGATLGPTAGNCNAMTAANCVATFQTTYQAASAAVGSQAPNPSYIPNLISSGSGIFLGALAPNYRTPYSIQMNAGIQRELRPGMVLSVDYLRNVALHYLIGVDANHSGDVRYFNKSAAQQAISATNNSFGCGTGTDTASINCAIAAGATMSSYGNNGLDSAADLGISGCQTGLGTSYPCAFTGVNPNLGLVTFLYPIGRSVYNALDVKLVDNVKAPFRGVKYLNFQFAYSLSRFTNCGAALSTSVGTSPAAADQDFVNPTIDNNSPCGFSGPSALDRTHQFSFGGYADLPAHFRLGTIFHFDSPLASALAVPVTGNGAGEIFATDFTGDGTTGDPIPGTKQGSFMRGVSLGDLANVVNNYNSTVANNPTPAGNVLINSGLFSLSQLQALGGVAPAISPVVPGEVGLTWLKTFDMSLTWIGKVNVKERELSFEPSVSFYNLFNFANFNIPGNVLSGILTGGAGSLNGTNYANANSVRVGVGTGVFDLGAPRTIEFGLKLTF